MEKFLEAMRLYFCFAVIIIMVTDVTGQGIEGGTMNIACGISGTYTYPGWIKDGSVIIAIEGSSSLNGLYASRFSFAADQKTLFVNPVNSSDAGSYVCSVTGLPPATTLITVRLPTTEPENNACSNPCPIVIAVYVFFVLAIVVITVVIIYCCYILIRANKEYQKMKVTQEDNNATAVLVILIIAAALFITITAWLIVMQATVEDCEEMTEKECNINIGLLVVEIVVFVLGVIAIILLYICHISERIEMKILRLKILQIITSAFPNPVSVEDLGRILVGVKLAIIKQQLKELETERNIKFERDGYVRRDYFFFKTGQLMNGSHSVKILQILTHTYPDILTVEDLRKIMKVEADIINEELEKLKKEYLIISRHCGFVVKDHEFKTELIRERILRFLGYAFPKALTTDDLCKIIAGVEDIGQHLTELEEDHLISSTKDGFVINPSETETTPDYPISDKCGGVKKPLSPGCERDTADVSPQHRPQPPLPPKERDKPRSEQSNIKTSNRGLSTVIDQEFDQPQTNRLTPLDHTVRDESIKRKKKKKTKTNNDNVKFDIDND